MAILTQDKIEQLRAQGAIDPAQAAGLAGQMGPPVPTVEDQIMAAQGPIPPLPIESNPEAVAQRQTEEEAQRQTVEDKLVDYSQQQAPVTPPQQQFGGVPQVSSMGLGGIQQSMKGQTQQYQKNLEETKEGLTEIGEQRTGALEKQKGAVLQQAQIESDVWKKMYDEQVAQQQRMIDLDNKKQEVKEQDQRFLDEAKQNAKYWNLDPLQRERYLKIIDPRSRATEADKKAAQAALAQASEIDPDRVYGGSAGVIMAAIFQGLGAFGSALSGGPNYASQIIQSAVKRDIDTQMDRRKAVGAKVSAAESTLDRNLQMFGNEKQAIAAETVGKMEVLKTQLQQLKVKYAGTEAEANIDKMIAEANEHQLLKQQEIDTMSNDKAIQSLGAQASVAGQRAQIASRNAELAAKQKVSDQALARQGLSPIPGLSVADPNLPVDKESVKIARASTSKFNKVRGLLDKMIKIREKHGSETLPTEAKRELQQLGPRLVVLMKDYDAMGANFTANEQALIEKQFPTDPAEFGFVVDKLSNMRSQIRDEIDTSLTPYNFKLADEQASDEELGAQQVKQ